MPAEVKTKSVGHKPKKLDEYTLAELCPYGVLPDKEPYLLPPFGAYNEWKVAKTFRYISPEGWLITVPENFLTDLASIPRLLLVFFGVNNRETCAAVIHDWGYRNNREMVRNVVTGERRCLAREEWDEIFLNVMLLAKTNIARAFVLYKGVRIGGGFHKNWRGQ